MEGKTVLHNLLGEEQSLRERAKMLKSEMEGLNSEIVSKQNQVDYLLAKVAELKLGKRQCKFPNDEGNGESHHERKLVNERDIEPDRLAEALLPEEIWRKMFGEMDGLDLLNANRACQHFQNILDPFKNNFLFGNILPFLIPYLDFKDVLKCRLVSKNWRSVMTSFLEDGAKVDMCDPGPNGFCQFHKDINNAIRPYAFQSSKLNPSDFLQCFNSVTTNPFIANSFIILQDCVSEKPSEKELEFCRGINTILETFGRHIHHFKWIGDDSLCESPRFVAFQVLLELFSNAPNLQTLVVKEDHFCVEDDCFPEIEMEDITDPLPHLETLVINMGTKRRCPIRDWLFQSFHLQIKKLTLQNFDCLLVASKFPWPQVTELGFEDCEEDKAGDYLECYLSFPGLEKLCLYIFCGTHLPKVFQFAKSLLTISPRFHILQLLHPGAFTLSPIEEESVYGQLFLPKELDTLEMIFLDSMLDKPWAGDFSFLLKLPYIKKLSIVWDPDLTCYWNSVCKKKNVKVEIIELLKYMAANSNPRSSNVWRMLPNLQTIQLKNNIYKRPKTFEYE